LWWVDGKNQIVGGEGVAAVGVGTVADENVVAENVAAGIGGGRGSDVRAGGGIVVAGGFVGDETQDFHGEHDETDAGSWQGSPSSTCM
jgi:hypothetical protein